MANLLKSAKRGFGIFLEQANIDIVAGFSKPQAILIWLFNAIFKVLFLGSAICLCVIFVHGIYNMLLHRNDVAEIIHQIELLFMSSLPLLIVHAFQSYFIRIIGPHISHKKEDFVFADQFREKALGDLSIVKYLFVSILLSTTFTVLLQIIFKLLIHSEENSVSKSYIEAHLYPAVIIGIVLIILLLFYFNILNKQVHNPRSHTAKEMSNREENVIIHAIERNLAQAQKAIDELDRDEEHGKHVD